MTNNQELSLQPLKKAVRSLQEAMANCKDDLDRDGVIQRFEYTFELAWKTLKRYFAANNQLHEDNVKNIFREAGKQGLIDSVENWFGYQRARNETSHIYSEKVAKRVFNAAKEFMKDVDHLLSKLEKLIE